MIVRAVAVSFDASLPRGERVGVARGIGEAALARCAERAGLGAVEFPRDEERAPVPLVVNGERHHWSTTNTAGLVAAALATARVGIDAEWTGRERLDAVLDYLDTDELERVRSVCELDERGAALALWSAKEAALKLTGEGIAGMGTAELVYVEASGPGERRLSIELPSDAYGVVQRTIGGPADGPGGARGDEHIVSVACEDEAFSLELERFAAQTPEGGAR